MGSVCKPKDEGALRPQERLGAYRIVECLGEGGMGRVYSAESLLDGQTVAIKVLHSRHSMKKDLLWRFYAESRAAAKVRHENIVEVKDFIEDKSSQRHYLVMELLVGQDLQQVLEREGALDHRRCVAIARQVAAALATAHRAGVVHRDLKPDNIFLAARDGRCDIVKLLDFGLAKQDECQGDLPGGLSPIESWQGEVFGTPAYMSPEQARGQQVDHRSDIYSFGVILFEMVTGVVPFEGRSFGELLVKHSLMPPPRPNGLVRLGSPLPARFEELILGCLKKQPEERPSSMEAVEAELAAIGPLIPPPLPLPS